MKDLNRSFAIALSIVNNCNIKIERPITKVSVNKRMKTTFGWCSCYPDHCEIEVNQRLLGDSVPDDILLDTLVHEILHACAIDCNHGGRWKQYADIVNKKYPALNIQHYATQEEEKAIGYKPIERKYAIQCQTCHGIHRSAKLSKSIKHPELFRCSCGGIFKRIA